MTRKESWETVMLLLRSQVTANTSFAQDIVVLYVIMMTKWTAGV